jgi:hypothetical protein
MGKTQMTLAAPSIFITLKWMTTPGQLIKVVAEATGVPEPTVFQHDRNLVVAGLRTKGGRGTSAAKVTVRDATHLLTAVLGSEQVKDSVATVQRYADTAMEDSAYSLNHREQAQPRTNPFRPLKVQALDRLPAMHGFFDLLDALLTMAAEGSFGVHFGRADWDPADVSQGESLRGIRLDLGWPMTHARVSLWLRDNEKSKLVYVGYGRPDGSVGGERYGPVQRTASIQGDPIREIGAVLGGRLDNPDDQAALERARSLAKLAYARPSVKSA